MSNNKQHQKKPDYYQPYKRVQIAKELLADLFIGISSWPRLVLEIPLRRDLGERFFSLGTCIWIVTLFAVTPYLTLIDWRAVFSQRTSYMSIDDLPKFSLWQLAKLYPGWYFLTTLFLGAAVKRRLEIVRYNRIWDMNRYSYSSGKIYPIFYNPWTIRLSLREGQFKLGSVHIGFLGRTFTLYASLVRVFVSARTVETFIEPVFGFVCGYLIRNLISETAGYLIQVCSVMYSFSSIAFYYRGDHFFMDRNDGRIIAEEHEQTFITNAPINPESGYRYVGRRPATQELRKRLLHTIVGCDDDDDREMETSSTSKPQGNAEIRKAILASDED